MSPHPCHRGLAEHARSHVRYTRGPTRESAARGPRPKGPICLAAPANCIFPGTVFPPVPSHPGRSGFRASGFHTTDRIIFPARTSVQPSVYDIRSCNIFLLARTKSLIFETSAISRIHSYTQPPSSPPPVQRAGAVVNSAIPPVGYWRAAAPSRNLYSARVLARPGGCEFPRRDGPAEYKRLH